MQQFLNVLNSKVLRPVLFLLIIAGALQISLNALLIRHQATSLETEVKARLDTSIEYQTQALEKSRQELLIALQVMQNESSRQMGEQLTRQLQTHADSIGNNRRQLLIGNTKVLAKTVGELAAPYIWDKDTPKLTEIVQLMDAQEGVVFAAFFDQYAKRMTRYVDRKDPLVKMLIKEGSGKGAIGKIINATENSDKIILVKSPIQPKGSVIGQLWIGLDASRLDAEQIAVKQQFQTTVANSEEAVRWVMNQQATELSDNYAVAMAELETEVSQENATVVDQINEQTSNLSSALIVSSLLSTIFLFSLTIAIIGIRMIVKINHLNKAVWNLTEGEADLSQRLNLPGNDELVHTAQGFNSLFERLQGLMRNIKQASSATNQQLSNQLTASTETNRFLQTQKSEVERVSASVHEMSLSVQEVTQSIQETADNVSEASNQTNATAQLSGTTRKELEQMVSDISQAGEVIHSVNENSQAIGSVLTVIRTIAEQTNLLALNAAIEAARAGESGRGFAVVADEVRTLASRTQQSTEEIQDIIDRLQRGSLEAVETMDRASQQVGGSMESFARADQQFERLNGLMSQLQQKAIEIASASEQQSVVAEEIAHNINSIASAADETAQSAQRSDEASQEIGKQVKGLEQQLNQFIV